MSTPDWMESAGLSEELKSNQTLLETPDVGTMARRLVDAQSEVGRRVRVPSAEAGAEDLAAFQATLSTEHPHLNLVNIPGKDSGDEAQAAFRKALGIPVGVDGYKFADFKPPEGVKLPYMDLFKETSLKAGLTEGQARMFLDFDMTRVSDTATASAKEKEVSDAALKVAWGDNFEALGKQARLAAQHYGGDELLKAVMEGATGKDALVMQALAKAGGKLVESGGDQMIAEIGAKTGLMSANEAKIRIAEIHNNPEHPIHFPRNKDAYDAAVNEITRLTKIKLGPGHDRDGGTQTIATG